MNDYQQYIHTSRYAKWNEDESRRETWEETVNRYCSFFGEKYPTYEEFIFKTLAPAIHDFDDMPSMRCMMTAGKALERDNVAGYNCAYTPINHIRVLDEILYILMCGTGVGFSVERQYISNLPEVPDELHESDTVIVVKDSKIGWSASFRELIHLLYGGQIPRWDTSRVRPRGAVLRTFGGRASGPEPLEDLFKYTIATFHKAVGRRFNSLELHDLVCKVADIVVVGGVRRSALISLSNLSDHRMEKAKTGDWFSSAPHRSLANNSVCYTEKPDMEAFLKEWSNLYESKSGERGIFFRTAAKAVAARTGRRDADFDFGTNPCSEIILRPQQFCNLTEVIVRSGDSLADLIRKVELATILGTLQSTLTSFRYLRRVWQTNTEEERLLGVSLTGIMDHPVLSGKEGNTLLKEYLTSMREKAIETNTKWAALLGISPSTAITCVKPSGTVSQLVDSSSGIHPRYSPTYIRRVRNSVDDPVSRFLIDQGVPYHPDPATSNTVVFDFPMKAPEGAICVKDLTAIQQLEHWKIYAEVWCEHKPSVTVYYSEEEFLDVGAWVYRNFHLLSGISFLPRSDHVYQLAPYEGIDAEQYDNLVNFFPSVIEWDKLSKYENTDMTTSSQELACVGGACEL